MINKKCRSFFIVVLCLIIYTLNVYASDYSYYYDYKIDGQSILLQENKCQLSSVKIEDKVNELFANLISINYNENSYNLVNENTKIKSVYFNAGELEVSFSEEILNYGGTMWEADMIDQLLGTFFSIKDVESISFYINRETTLFVEGTEIMDFNRSELDERIKQNAENRR